MVVWVVRREAGALKGRIVFVLLWAMAVGRPGMAAAQNPGPIGNGKSQGANPAGGAKAQGANSAGATKQAASTPNTMSVELAGQVPPEDRSNLKDYWARLQSRTNERWQQIIPAQAKPPLSTAGQVKIVCRVHTDGRVTNMALEQPSRNTALDRAAWAAITGSSPFEAFPYGIAVEQVKVRFTFTYNGGAPVGGPAPRR